jgi:hypothetical protein
MFDIENYIKTTNELAEEWGIPKAELIKIQAETILNCCKPVPINLRIYEILDEIEVLEKKLEDENSYYLKLFKQDLPYWFRSLSWERIQVLKKKLSELKMSLEMIKRIKKGNGISEDIIQKAKQVSWEKLLKVRNGMALCPFHKDTRPSFSVQKGYGHCFGCGWTGDQIAFLMKRDNLSFKEAVEKLAGIC